MSADDLEAEAADVCCASCGIAEVDDTKLKECDGCDLVRYCSDECQREHRPEHESKCRERAAELRDEILFRQPESSYLGDCPICYLPLPISIDQNFTNRVQTCCSKIICGGCTYSNDFCQVRDKTQFKCPFCRHPVPASLEEAEKNKMKRIAANDPLAMSRMGLSRIDEGDYEGALKYLTKAVELGDVSAHYDLAVMYMKGEGVEKDEKKSIYHLEEASVRGHPNARHHLACYEGRNGRIDRAVKHFIIAANLGFDKSIQALKDHYKNGDVSKDDFAATLRAHHAAVNATKSPQREEAAKYYAKHR